MLLGLCATAALGLWQYSVAHRDDVARQVLAAPAVEFSSVSSVGRYVPEVSYGQRVILVGQLECALGFRVKPLAQEWQVCPLKLADGTSVAIVMGLANESVLPNAQATIEGKLQPAQDASQLSPTYTISSLVPVINTDDLVLRWQSDAHDGYVVAEKIIVQDQPLTSFEPIPQSEIVTPPVGIELRNLLYAWQWWVFSSFVLFLYFRFVRDEVRLRSVHSPQNSGQTESSQS